MSAWTMLQLAVMTNSAHAFETGVENLMQQELGIVDRFRRMFPAWDTHEAMTLFKDDQEKFLDELAGRIVQRTEDTQ